MVNGTMAGSSAGPIRRVLCSFCGAEFGEDSSQPTCRSCPFKRGCGSVRCTHCGYENPAVPGWLDAWLTRVQQVTYAWRGPGPEHDPHREDA
jgi:hypothetical protein